jgi:hypothetical protein
MSPLHPFKLCILTALAMAGLQAQASTVTLGTGSQTEVSGALTDTFDTADSFFSVTGGSTYSSASAGAHLTSDNIYLLDGISAQPKKGAASANDAWFSVGQGQSATFNFATPVNYVGFLWGSVDTYNTLEIFNGSTLLATYTGGNGGLDAFQVPDGNGNQGKSVYFNFSADSITSIKLVSTGPAFEIDNLSVSQIANGGQTLPVPEPQSWALLLAGLFTVGSIARRRMR